MPITTQQFQTWLTDPRAFRCILIEVDVGLNAGGTATRYLSNRGYVTQASETPANTLYEALIMGGVNFQETLNIDGTVSVSYGDIELNNTDGSLDSWLNDYWVNRSIRIYIGDSTWGRADFRQIFGGITTGIDSRNRTRVNIKLSDKLQRLNTPVTETKLNNGGPYSDSLLPLCFGECHNVTPLVTNGPALEYMVHNGPIESIIEVRDNGVPVAFTPNLAQGKFNLSNSPVGTITVSVQGAKLGGTTYANDIVSIITELATNYGNVNNKFTTADLDTVSLAAFQAAHPQPVGIYLADRTNVLDAINQLAQSIGAAALVSKQGLLKLVQLQLPQSSSGTQVTNVNMKDRTLEISQMPPVVAGVKIGYCKNWTVQNNLQTGLTQDQMQLFSEEYLTKTMTDSAAATNFNIWQDPNETDTLLLVGVDAINEATRRLNIFNVQRKVLKYTAYADLMMEDLGSPQTITHSRFGLANGGTGQVVSINTDWINQRVDFEVLM
jgi:hypothetical protein